MFAVNWDRRHVCRPRAQHDLEVYVRRHSVPGMGVESVSVGGRIRLRGGGGEFASGVGVGVNPSRHAVSGTFRSPGSGSIPYGGVIDVGKSYYHQLLFQGSFHQSETVACAWVDLSL